MLGTQDTGKHRLCIPTDCVVHQPSHPAPRGRILCVSPVQGMMQTRNLKYVPCALGAALRFPKMKTQKVEPQQLECSPKETSRGHSRAGGPSRNCTKDNVVSASLPEPSPPGPGRCVHTLLKFLPSLLCGALGELRFCLHFFFKDLFLLYSCIVCVCVIYAYAHM